METEKKMNWLLRVIDKAVQAKYSVPAWLWAIASLTVGLLIILVTLFDPASATEFLSSLPFGGLLFGPLTALSAVVAMFGMATDNPRAVRVGSFASFCVWLFVGLAFGATNVLNVFILPLPMLVFWGYKYLASFVRERNGV